MAKASTKKTRTTKKELLDEAIAEAVGAGKELHLESVDFSDPNRPKTCLEVDFPILPINKISRLEGSSGATRKPIYQITKWWARRNSSVFRSMLIAAATKAPDDPGEAAKLVWDSYYGNHQKNEEFQRLKVADIFMGGGTTIVEGARLGMQMFGNDLNPVAWFVVKNELAQVNPAEVQKLLNHIEVEVKPQIMPFYACDCPRGHKGKWTQRSTGKEMGKTFDPLGLNHDERADYEYEGPQVIYTFWVKHGPCQATGCGHRTPIMSTPVIAVKTLTVRAWIDRSCRKCHKDFDIEQHDARIAPAALFVCAPDEKPYAAMDGAGNYACPHCGYGHQESTAKENGDSSSLGKAKNKSVELTLLIHPDWLKGSSGKSSDGKWFGGSATDDAPSTAAWNGERQKTLRHIEVRGTLPTEIVCPDTHETYRTDTATVPRQSTFTCMAATCGKQWDVMDAVESTSKTGPVAANAFHGYCPSCDREGFPYSGRFFDCPNPASSGRANTEWEVRREVDLAPFWPRCEVYPYRKGNDSKLYIQPQHGFTHWWLMFNSRQRLVLSCLLKSILGSDDFEWHVREAVLGAFQQYLRNQNVFCFWNQQADQLEPLFSNNNYHPKSTMIENGVFSKLGRGNWQSCSSGLIEGLEWRSYPLEMVVLKELAVSHPVLASQATGQSARVGSNDPVLFGCKLTCSSSTSLELASNDYIP